MCAKIPVQQTTAQKIQDLIEKDLLSEGYEPVEIKYSAGARRPYIRIFIDKPGGVTLDDCCRASRIINFLLQNEESWLTDYRLEVSSPGLDRPLVCEADFKRHAGKAVEVWLSGMVNDANYFEGIIESASNGIIRLRIAKEVVEIPVEIISKGKLKI